MLFHSCGKVVKVDKISMKWSNFDLDLPEGIEVYEGINKDIPLKAWVAKVDLSQENISVKVLSSNDKDQRETPMQFSENNNARIIINGGYFNSEKNPIEHVGLLKTNGKLILEIGHDQKYKVTKFLKEKNFCINKIIKDYGKNIRCIVSTKIN